MIFSSLGDGGEDLVAVERGPRAVPDRRLLVGSGRRLEPLAVLGGGGEDLLADQVGGDVGDDLELGAVFQHLGQPAVHERRLAPAAEQVVDLLLDLAAGHPHPLAEDHQQALGRLEPLRAVAIQVERDHPLLGGPDPDEITGEHEESNCGESSDRTRTSRHSMDLSGGLKSQAHRVSLHYKPAHPGPSAGFAVPPRIWSKLNPAAETPFLETTFVDLTLRTVVQKFEARTEGSI